LLQGLFRPDGFDPSRHEVTTQASAGSRLRKSIPPLVEVARQPLRTLVPCPEAYYDASSDPLPTTGACAPPVLRPAPSPPHAGGGNPHVRHPAAGGGNSCIRDLFATTCSPY
jgi:hypothetical protein